MLTMCYRFANDFARNWNEMKRAARICVASVDSVYDLKKWNGPFLIWSIKEMTEKNNLMSFISRYD